MAATNFLYNSVALIPGATKLGKQSSTYNFASISVINASSGLSSFPLPENPKLITGSSSFLDKMDDQASPGLVAQAP